MHLFAAALTLSSIPVSLLVIGLASFVYVAINALSRLIARQHSAWIKQVGAWVIGILISFAVAATQLGKSADFGPVSWHNLNLAAQALLGLLGSSVASTVFHALQRLDSTDPGSVVPPVLNSPAPAPAPTPAAVTVTGAQQAY